MSAECCTAISSLPKSCSTVMGRVRITDFGLAIAAEDESHAVEIAGTPAYMAPEQLAGKGATVRSANRKRTAFTIQTAWNRQGPSWRGA